MVKSNEGQSVIAHTVRTKTPFVDIITDIVDPPNG